MIRKKLNNNKLNKVKSAAKKCYFASQFSLNKNNMKMTWKLIGMIVNRYKKKSTFISKILCDGKYFTERKEICDKLNEHFINVGQNLASQLPTTNVTPARFINKPLSNSFMFRSICTYEVTDLINSINPLSELQCHALRWQAVLLVKL